ncbi:MAG: WhiB family transcriptional regulator [Ilumatobacteraceae bacterium]|jgi:hypothetical protein
MYATQLLPDTTAQTLVEVLTATSTINWQRARCADGNGTLSALFFSDDVIDIARSKAICSKCTLTEACLQGALDRAEPWGVWGGELVENGRVVVDKRPRGRPPKHPRGPLVVDEVPIPAHLIAERVA